MVAFVTVLLPTARKRRWRSNFRAQAEDQWEQFSQADKRNRKRQFELCRSSHVRDRHSQVFYQQSATRAFNGAAQRLVDSSHRSCAIATGIRDDTFGRLRGDPYPPRSMLMRRLKRSDNGEDFVDEVGAKWIDALNRLGKSFSSLSSYHVDYSVWGEWGELNIKLDGLFACEIVNADWARPAATDEMKQILMNHGESVVNNGYAIGFKVLQSIDEPTMFKTVEIYPKLENLEQYMKEMDPTFEGDVMTCRAAVNRVRQLYRCTHYAVRD